MGKRRVATLWKYCLGTRRFTLLHSFANRADGGSPGGPSIDHKGILWGITVYGQNCYNCGQGTVWKYKPGPKTFATVLRFSSTGISNPMTNFAIDERGNLFGTAMPTDGSNPGTIYELEKKNKEDNNYVPKLLYTFTDKTNGWAPFGQLRFDKGGNLIGTTYLGGEFGDGTVYELIDKNGAWEEKVLHSFEGSDGSTPLTGLVTDHQDKWFGTAEGGGKHGWGAVFELYGVL